MQPGARAIKHHGKPERKEITRGELLQFLHGHGISGSKILLPDGLGDLVEKKRHLLFRQIVLKGQQGVQIRIQQPCQGRKQPNVGI